MSDPVAVGVEAGRRQRSEKQRTFRLPAEMRSAWLGETATLDELDLLVDKPGDVADWARAQVEKDAYRRLDVAVGRYGDLPMGVVIPIEDQDLDLLVGLVSDAGCIAGTSGAEILELNPELIYLSVEEAGFALRAFAEGSAGVLLKPDIPVAFLEQKDGALVAAADGEMPAGSQLIAIVDDVDKNAVLDLIMVTPGPHVYRRNDGTWQPDDEWVGILRSTRPPPIVAVTSSLAPSVIAQVDESTKGQPFEKTERTTHASGFTAELERATDDVTLELLPLIAAQGRLKSKAYDVTGKMPGQLQRYWVFGKGAAKIRWGTPGAWRRCYRHLSKYLGPIKAKGACTNLGKKLGGRGVAWDVLRHGKGHRGSAAPEESFLVAAADFDPDLHPRGRDGKFIEKLGFVFAYGGPDGKKVRGQVVNIEPDPKRPGNPFIEVKVGDNARFFRSKDIEQAPGAKAEIGKASTPKEPTKTDAGGAVKNPVLPARRAVPPVTVPPLSPTPRMTPDPSGPNLKPWTPPKGFEAMPQTQQAKLVGDSLAEELTAWRGKPTTVDFVGSDLHYTMFDPGVAIAMANRYREIANHDPETARRVDVIATDNKIGRAIAVADPGTQHPGGIGPVVGPVRIRFNPKYFRGGKFWTEKKAPTLSGGLPWSTSDMTNDGTVSLVHEFGHQRQYRFLETAMKDANRPFSGAVRDDGFGLVPDSSNWQETQSLRYQIPKLTPTKYGHSKTSEGYAEAFAAQMIGNSSPELDDAMAKWESYMGLPGQLPRHDGATRSWDELTPEERDTFWQENGKYLDLPGMRDHYPESAQDYDLWKAAHPDVVDGLPPAEGTTGSGDSPDDPVRGLTSADDALQLVLAGKYVEMDPSLLSISLEKLAKIGNDARAKGEKAPLYDLCKISVPDTNLFCAEAVVQSRFEMPQLSGKPKPGSPADSLPKNARGNVDLSPGFIAALKADGVDLREERALASQLKASQNELNGPQVASMMDALASGTLPDRAIFVSSDNYVVDGHHKWAATVAEDWVADQHAGDLDMAVIRVGLPIQQVLDRAHEYVAAQGVEAKVASGVAA